MKGNGRSKGKGRGRDLSAVKSAAAEPRRKRGRQQVSVPVIGEEAAEGGLGGSGVMTLKQAAAYLKCHTSTLYRLVNRGDIPAFRLGGGWRFLRSEMDRWIDGQRGEGGAGN